MKEHNIAKGKGRELVREERKEKKRKGEVTMNFGETDLKAQHNVADADGDSKEIK